jgi:O-antigen ligase
MDIFKRTSLFEKKLLSFIVLLIPTQLTYHLWSDWSHVQGIRIDYLAITIYFTDLLIISFILIKILTFVQKNTTPKLDKKVLGITTVALLLMSINILLSASVFAAFYKWVRILALVFFVLILQTYKKDELGKIISKPLFLSIITVSLLAIFQFLKQGSLNGIFYYLGERRISVNDPGIALVNIFSKQYLRAYSTFPHPNALSGFLLAGSLFYYSVSRKLTTPFFVMVFVVALLLTFSKAAILSVGIILVVNGAIKRFKFSSRFVLKSFFTVLISISIFSMIIFGGLKYYQYGHVQTVSNRIQLIRSMGEMFARSPFTGVGLNNFIVNLPQTTVKPDVIWWLQPVHNVYLLLLVEGGVFLFMLFVFYLFKLINKLDESSLGGRYLALSLLSIILTSFFDHYWFTIQQNMLLSALIISYTLSTRKKL